jgi:acyl-coenzyme A thioesterase PaaI-like protein
VNRAPEPWPPASAELPDPHPEAPAPGTRLASHYARCFGCGDEQEHGLHLQATVADGYTLHASFTVTEAHQGAPGLAHGGLLACAFDEALGTAVGHLVRQPAVTGRLETDFVRPVPVGSTLYITSRLGGVAGRQVFVGAYGRLDSVDGPVAVRARAIFVIVQFTHFTSHGRKEDLDSVAKDPTLLRRRSYDINP